MRNFWNRDRNFNIKDDNDALKIFDSYFKIPISISWILIDCLISKKQIVDLTTESDLDF